MKCFIFRYKLYIYSILLSLGVMFSAVVSAAVPDRTVGFQGQLYSNGTPVSASVNATFTFYDSLSGGSVTGSPISKTVTVNNGYFGSQFSDSDMAGVNFNQKLYLEVAVNGTTLSPRTTINPTLASLRTFGTFSYTSAPTVGPIGSLYYNSTLGGLFVSDGNAWISASFGTSTVVSLANGGTGATTTAAARANLGIQFATSSDYADTTPITAWGDSMTAGAGGTPYPTQLAALSGRALTYNGGAGAQTSTQIAVRQGGVSTTATVVGGQIPASGGVTVTFPTGYEPVTSQGPTVTYGTIAGVYGGCYSIFWCVYIYQINCRKRSERSI